MLLSPLTLVFNFLFSSWPFLPFLPDFIARWACSIPSSTLAGRSPTITQYSREVCRKDDASSPRNNQSKDLAGMQTACPREPSCRYLQPSLLFQGKREVLCSEIGATQSESALKLERPKTKCSDKLRPKIKCSDKLRPKTKCSVMLRPKIKCSE